MLENNYFWLAIGLIGGVLLGAVADFSARKMYENWRRPRLEIARSGEGLYIVKTTATINVTGQSPPQHQQITAYRIRVANKGKIAAENARGTIEFMAGQERRICWYEGDVPEIVINAYDHSFLDLYGIISTNPPTVCFPTESGWDNIQAVPLSTGLVFVLRVTAANARQDRKTLAIDPSLGCQLVLNPPTP